MYFFMFYTDDDIKKLLSLMLGTRKKKRPFRKGGFFCASQSSISNGACAIGNIELLLVPNVSKKIFYILYVNNLERSRTMIKIRLHGTMKETKEAIQNLQESFDILYQSEPYKDRGQSVYYRTYLDCERKEM